MRDIALFGFGHDVKVRPPILPADALTGGLAYHRLSYMRPRAAWWTPLLVAVVGSALYVTEIVVFTLLFVSIGALDPAVAQALTVMGTGALFDPNNPIVLALGLATIALMLPAYALASRIVQGPKLGYISSAAGRLRWGWLLLCVAVALGLNLVVTALSALLPASSEAPEPPAAPNATTLLAGLAVVVLLVPVQAAAEEYVFRGFLMQSIGRWLRHPGFAILLPIPLFVLGHGYDPVGQTSVAIFALVAGWLSWRTGGLEAAIALHVINNLGAFALGVLGLADPNETEISVESLLVSVVFMLAYAAVIEWVFRRRGLGRTVVVMLPPPTLVAPLAPTDLDDESDAPQA